MKRLSFSKEDFTLFIGEEGWYVDPRDGRHRHLVITSQGVFFDGVKILEGKLRRMK